jgi:hypothetical protein
MNFTYFPLFFVFSFGFADVKCASPTQMNTKRDPAIDVFSFALILFEILFGEKVFPESLSDGDVFREALRSHRPLIKTTLHQILQELISRGWSTESDQRPTFE